MRSSEPHWVSYRLWEMVNSPYWYRWSARFDKFQDKLISLGVDEFKEKMAKRKHSCGSMTEIT